LDVVIAMLKVFPVDVYAFLALGATLPFVILYLAMRYEMMIVRYERTLYVDIKHNYFYHPRI